MPTNSPFDSDESRDDDPMQSRRERDPDESLTIQIARAVADFLGVEPSALDPIYWDVPVEAIDAVVSNTDGSVVNFTTHGAGVTVNTDWIVVGPAAGPTTVPRVEDSDS